MHFLNIGFVAVVAITFLLLFYSGMLLHLGLVRRQLFHVNLRDLGRLALTHPAPARSRRREETGTMKSRLTIARHAQGALISPVGRKPT